MIRHDPSPSSYPFRIHEPDGSRGDQWFAYQLWQKRGCYAGGVCNAYGDWSSQCKELLSDYSNLTAINNLNRLLEIPSVYVAMIDLSSQTKFCSDFLIPYIFHFRTTPFPPPLFVFGLAGTANYPPHDKRAVFIRPKGTLHQTSEAKTTNLFGGLISLSDTRTAISVDNWTEQDGSFPFVSEIKFQIFR